MRSLVLLFFICLFLSCSVYRRAETVPKTEFRGVWIATVVNIDWPKKAYDPVSKQKQDFIEILDFYKTLNFNAAIVQIRTAGDAFYPTELAPWSKYLTGKEGNPPKDFENALDWMITETHKRGMEFHAWLNPYRATFDLDTVALSERHDFYRHPEWMIKYGKKYYYNPGLPEVQQKLTDVITEVVKKYPVDAIHFDDYFYPYKVKGETFTDSITFQTYGLPNQSPEDWRRSNVDTLVKKVHKAIKATKPWVQFGISPFGVWKNKDTDPNGSDTKAGQTNYEDLYADPLLWMEKGWLDYLVPQAYWSMDYPPASHRVVAQWWAEKAKNVNLYVGNGPYKIKNNKDKAWNRKNEIPKQLTLARNQKEITGNVFFSAKSLMGKHKNVVNTLKRKFYPIPAQNPSKRNGIKRDLALPDITSTQTLRKNVTVCVSHTDSIPRFVHFYNFAPIGGPDEKILIGKSYLSENETSNCINLKLTKNQLKHDIGIEVMDAFGNKSKLMSINANPKRR